MVEIYGGHSNKIGNYIHYKPSFYLMLGLQKPPAAKSWSPNSAVRYLNGMHNKMYEKAKNSHIKKAGKAEELARLLNLFYGGNLSSEGKDSDIERTFRDALYNSLLTYLEQYIYGNLELDFEHLSTIFSDEEFNAMSFTEIGRMKNKKQKNSTVKLGVFRTKLKNLKTALEKAQENIGKEIASKGFISEKRGSDLQKIEEELKSLETDIQTLSADTRSEDTQIYLKRNGNITKQGNIAQRFNSTRNQFIMTKAKMMGEIGEYIVPAILFMLQNQANENIGELMESFAKDMADSEKHSFSMGNNSYNMTGTQSTNKGLFSANFAFDLGDLLGHSKNGGTLGYTETDADGNLISTRATADKVDVEIQYLDEDYNLSIKNYNLKYNQSNISIFHGNLFRLIQHETDFINHYLNITSVREETEESIPMFLISLAKRNLKELLMIKGLTGGIQIGSTAFTKEADYLVVNDASAGKFYVYNMGTLITSIFNLGERVYQIEYDKSIEGLKQNYYGDIRNPKERSKSIGERRAINLASQLLDKHVDMYIKQGLIKNLTP